MDFAGRYNCSMPPRIAIPVPRIRSGSGITILHSIGTIEVRINSDTIPIVRNYHRVWFIQ